jgi:phage shock protein A
MGKKEKKLINKTLKDAEKEAVKLKTTIVDVIERQMKVKNMSVSDLAQAMDVSRKDVLNALDTSNTDLDFDTLANINVTLGIGIRLTLN